MDLADYACLLRDAARATAANWAEPLDQSGHDRAIRHLGITVRDLRIVLAQLAGRFRLGTMMPPEPASAARAAAATEGTHALGQAWRLLEDATPAETAPAHDACVPGDLLCYAARRAATWLMPVTGLDQLIQPLADTLAALEIGTACLAVGDARLVAVRAHLETARNQLKNVPQPAVPPARACAGRPKPLPCTRPSRRRT